MSFAEYSPLPFPEDPAGNPRMFRLAPSEQAAGFGGTSALRGQGELILAVDDEPTVRMLNRQMLERSGYRVITAENGAEGLALYKAHAGEVALVLTDMTMPVMDGLVMAATLRELNPALLVIVASGTDNEPAREKFRSCGVRHFLPKPYSANALAHAVHAALQESVPARGR